MKGDVPKSGLGASTTGAEDDGAAADDVCGVDAPKLKGSFGGSAALGLEVADAPPKSDAGWVELDDPGAPNKNADFASAALVSFMVCVSIFDGVPKPKLVGGVSGTATGLAALNANGAGAMASSAGLMKGKRGAVLDETEGTGVSSATLIPAVGWDVVEGTSEEVFGNAEIGAGVPKPGNRGALLGSAVLFSPSFGVFA